MIDDAINEIEAKPRRPIVARGQIKHTEKLARKFPRESYAVIAWYVTFAHVSRRRNSSN